MKTLLLILLIIAVALYIFSPAFRELVKEGLKNLLLSDKLMTQNIKQLMKEGYKLNSFKAKGTKRKAGKEESPKTSEIYIDTGIYRESGIFKQIGKTILDQWYVFFFLAFLFVVVLYTAVGYDMLQSIIDNEALRFWRLIYLTFFLVLFCLSIWLIPFWVLVRAEMGDLRQKADFLVKTVLISFIAMIPYGIIATGFYVHESTYIESLGRDPWLQFIILGVIFCLLQVFFRNRFLIFIKWSDRQLNRIFGFYRKIDNYYVKMLIYMSVLQLLTVGLAIGIFALLPKEENYYRYAFFGFLLVSGLVTFLILYNIPLINEEEPVEANDDNYARRWDKKENIDSSLELYFEKENTKYSRWLFWFVLTVLAGVNFSYFIMPSLTHVNTLFIVLPLFALNVVLFNYLRNLYRVSKMWMKFLAFAAIVGFFVLPFISPKEQFNLNLIPMDEPVPSFDDLLKARMDYISQTQGDSVFYIVCGQGGGSRAGYVMTGVLETLDSLYPGFLDRTLMYSTISGSSPGVYHYLKARSEVDDIVKRREVYRGIYKENLNSGSVFGFFSADNIDAATGGRISEAFLKPSVEYEAYFDRNERIKYEYDKALFRELGYAKNIDDYGRGAVIKVNQIDEILNSFSTPENMEQDVYMEFMTQGPSQPLHLINTLEVNWGRRAVVVPGKVGDDTVFLNAVLPLENEKLVGKAGYMDIKYRDAVNLSELFPILSAAQTLNGDETMQFVDGGYYENFGLTTAMDVYKYIKEEYPEYADKVQIVLIKNSLQLPDKSNKQFQLFAPLTGLMKAPFTGHSNYLDELALKELKEARYKVIAFDEKEYDISLTRGLTKKHIKSLDRWISGPLSAEIEEVFKNE